MERDIYKTSRVLYVIEAALEYFITIMVGGAYLARLAVELDIPDNVTGILSSFVTLACCFQIFSIPLFQKGRAKLRVIVWHSVSQLAFCVLYVVPFFEFSSGAKSAVFIAMLGCACISHQIVQSPKLNWYMSLIDDRKRGEFTANKEIVSLFGGMIFSFAMGALIDRFEAMGKTRVSFLLCGITLLVLTVLHTLTLIFSREKDRTKEELCSTGELMRLLLRDKRFFKIILVSVFWNVAHLVATPFYGTYQIKELGFSMTFVSILSIVYAVCRSVFSRPLGRYADQTSFVNMLNVCFAVAMVAFLVNTFTVPANGKIFYTLYYVLYAISMGGINSASVNLIYEQVSPEKRVCALALKNTLAGLGGFLATVLAGMLVERVQANGNMLFGIEVYAQQVVSAIASVLIALTLVYLNTVVRGMKKAPLDKERAEG